MNRILESRDPVALNELIAEFGKSERSIRYDIKTIREELAEYGICLESKSGDGYYIIATQIPECINLLNSGKLNDEQIINEDLAAKSFCLLFGKGGYETLDSLTLKVNSSKGTLNKSLKDFNSQHAGINFEFGRKGVRLSGDEYFLREKAIQYSSILFQSFTLSDDERQGVNDAVKKANEAFDVWITAKGFRDLTSYCEVSLIRKKNSGTTYDTKFLDHDETLYAAFLLKELGIESNGKELACMVRHMIHCGVVVSEDGILQQKTAEETDGLIDRIEQECRKRDVWLSKSDLSRDLKRHLNQLAKCLVYGIEPPENPMLINIKTNYREAFEIAKDAAQGWKFCGGHELSESEVSYVAIYIYQDTQHKPHESKKVLVVCATGKGLSSVFASKIADRFPDLEIVGLDSAYHALSDTKGADFIISTVPIREASIPVVVVTAMLNDLDLDLIDSYVHGGIHPKNAPLETGALNPAIDSGELKKASESIGAALLALIDTLNDLPNEFHLSTEVINALLIHLVFAIPRWCSPDEEANDMAGKQLLSYRKKNPEITALMDGFFKKTEQVLGVQISEGERVAFYVYILRGN